MSLRPSPPLKPIDNPYYHQRPPSLLNRHGSKLLYLAIATCLLYIYHLSPIHLLPTSSHPQNTNPLLNNKHIPWTQYAYSQYATSSAYLCNAVMVFESLHRLNSRADRILFYPRQWDTVISSSRDRDSQLLVKARDWYNVRLMPVDILPKAGEKDDWNGGFAKFLAWGLTDYLRVLHIDSDVTVLRHLDELFLVPGEAVAMLRAYWLLPQERRLTSLFVLLEPSEAEYQRLIAASRADVRSKGEYDMEILNRFYGDSAMVLPHRKYGLLSGEFRRSHSDHAAFLGNEHEEWDPGRTLRGASLVHFSDWPLPKPWIMWPYKLIGEVGPKCRYGEGGVVLDCADKEVWMGLYDDFRRRRKDVCALLSAPAPEWPPRNDTEGA